MNNPDFIPRRDREFNLWQENLIRYATAHLSTWNVPTEDFTELKALQTAFTALYAVSTDASRCTKPVTLEKNVALGAYKKGIRQFVREYLTHNRRVGDDDRVSMNLPVRDGTLSRARSVTGMPVGRVDYSIHQRHTIRVADSSGRRRAEGASGFEVWRKIGGERPLSDGDYHYAGFSSSTSLTLDYALEDVGKVVYYRFRWVNSRNEPGPWSMATLSVVIA
ncbi:MAG: hypothetical protein LBK07_04455 [Tannerella sp.]|jgi:hypothetical protein|nr:hypothetical protein [Tannerella sp.]